MGERSWEVRVADVTFYGRLAVGGIVIAWMQWGPIAHQVMGQRVGWGMMTWRMYYGAAREVCDVRYYVVDEGGNRTLIDRMEALGYDDYWDANKRIRRVSDRSHVERQGRTICREYLPAGAALEAEARCGSYKGWVPETFDGPLCHGSVRAGQDKQPKRKPRRRGGDQ